MLRLFASAAVVAASVTASQAANVDLPIYSEVEGWTIRINEAAGNGCMMEKYFDDGTLFQVGAIPAENGGFFAAYNKAWTQIEDGASGSVHFDFDGERFGGAAVGKVSGDWHGGYAFFNNPNLAYDFARKYDVTISGGETALTTVDLTGSFKAVEEVLKCQSEQS